jgi:hypothetical protein
LNKIYYICNSVDEIIKELENWNLRKWMDENKLQLRPQCGRNLKTENI